MVLPLFYFCLHKTSILKLQQKFLFHNLYNNFFVSLYALFYYLYSTIYNFLLKNDNLGIIPIDYLLNYSNNFHLYDEFQEDSS